VNIGFVSTRLAGTDGVSLEAAKLADILGRMGHHVAYCAGQLVSDGPPGRLVPELHFAHPDVRRLHDAAFAGKPIAALEDRIADLARHIRPAIEAFIEDFEIDVLVTQNAQTIPMNLPLGVALADIIGDTRIATIAHHHDFYWERERFGGSGIQGLLDRVFPPDLPSIRHVTINSLARDALRDRRGLASWVLPNVLDYARGPEDRPDRRDEVRRCLSLAPDDIVLLQPTRIVPRKGIEHAIELARRLTPDLSPRIVRVLITHPVGDEGTAYLAWLEALARTSNVRLDIAADRFAERRQDSRSGEPQLDLQDAYELADLVTYPSLIEGFGNALLEAVFYRRPLMVNRYSVYVADIEPHGFDVIAMDGKVDDETVCDALAVLNDPARRAEMVDHNYAVAARHFSYDVAGGVLQNVLDSFQ